MKHGMNEKLNAYLSYKEIVCRCGCGFGLEDGDFDDEMVSKFYTMRVMFGEAITVTSGCRCVTHNAKKSVGGMPNSKHLKGRAVDITCANPTAERLAMLAFCAGKAGFKYCEVKLAKRILHVDIR